MTLESQVVSLPLAKRLKELGVKQDAIFNWTDGDFFDSPEGSKPRLIFGMGSFPLDRLWAAFTVAELGEMLPEWVATYKTASEGINWCCIKYVPGEIPKYTHCEWGRSEADARAKMLIYLIENKLITV